MTDDNEFYHELHTYEGLLAERISLLKRYKLELRKDKNKLLAFNTFKQLCRNRKIDALAGYCKTPEGFYYWKY